MQVGAVAGQQVGDVDVKPAAVERGDVATGLGHQQRGGGHVITAASEHKAVLDPCGWLERSGVPVTYLAPGPDGRIDPRAVADALREDTVLVSIMHANNETGVINDIDAIGAIPDNQHMRTLLQVLAHPSQAGRMVQGEYVIMGIFSGDDGETPRQRSVKMD